MSKNNTVPSALVASPTGPAAQYLRPQSFLDPFGKGGNRKGGNEKHFQMKGGNGGNEV